MNCSFRDFCRDFQGRGVGTQLKATLCVIVGTMSMTELQKLVQKSLETWYKRSLRPQTEKTGEIAPEDRHLEAIPP